MLIPWGKMLSMEALSINIPYLFLKSYYLFSFLFSFFFLVILFHFKSIQTPIDILSDHSKISALSMLSLNIYHDGLNIVFAMFGSSIVRIKYYKSNT